MKVVTNHKDYREDPKGTLYRLRNGETSPRTSECGSGHMGSFSSGGWNYYSDGKYCRSRRELQDPHPMDIVERL